MTKKDQILFLNNTLWLSIESTTYYESYDCIGQNLYQRHIPGRFPCFVCIELALVCDNEDDDESVKYLIKSVTKDEYVENVGKITCKSVLDAQNKAIRCELISYCPARNTYCSCCFGNTFLQTNHGNKSE